MSRPAFIALLCALACAGSTTAAQKPKRPNVILIMTDDQGHGDLGFHGNPKIRTPHLDRLAKQGTRLTRFFVCPVCSPTRSSLMSGRYNYRTGVVDTYLGRSMMHPDEVTLAELLATAGYRTGIFGKWHLGDNYPLRPTDQGFHEALVLKGGGIAQPSDPPGGDGYFDPVLYRNGKAEKTKGYVSDVITDAALDFIGKNRDRPFLVYLAYNAPHGPLQVPEKYYQLYRKMNLAHGAFPQIGQPLPGKSQQDVTARVYGMVTNVDDNLGRLFARLNELKLADDTIVIFLTDNGPQQVRYNSGMLGRKGSVHEGGVRVAFFIRWPGKIPADRDVDRIAAATKRPERVVGQHWVQPAFLIPAVEVVRGDQTSPEAVEFCRALLERANKKPVVCKDIPGFIFNRFQHVLYTEALSIVEQGAATIEDVDNAFRYGLSMRYPIWSILGTHDRAATKVTSLHVERYLRESTGDPKFGPSPLMEEKVAKGEIGIWAGKGWYDYSGQSVEALIEDRDRKITRMMALLEQNGFM